MSRWLQHYSPFAVLVRLFSLSILLSFLSLQLFRLTRATDASLLSLSRSLPCWIGISVVLMLAYFVSQQDIAVADDRDDRRRRLVLRLKCLYVVAGCSLFSLLTLVGILQVGQSGEWDWKEWKNWARDAGIWEFRSFVAELRVLFNGVMAAVGLPRREL